MNYRFRIKIATSYDNYEFQESQVFTVESVNKNRFAKQATIIWIIIRIWYWLVPNKTMSSPKYANFMVPIPKSWPIFLITAAAYFISELPDQDS